VTDFAEVRDTLHGGVSKALPDHTVYLYVPRSIVPPCVIIEPSPHNTINYELAMSSGFAEWNLTTKVIVGQVNDEWAQKVVAEHITPQSPLITAIEAVEFGAGAGGGWARVYRAGISQMMFGKALYTYAELSVRVKT